MLVNDYQSILHTDKMYQASLAPRPLPAFNCLQYGKDFSFACGESLGNSGFKEAKVIDADNCKHRQAPACQKQRVAEIVSSTGMTR